MATTISGTAGVTFPAGGVGNPAGSVVGTTDTQTLTNKTLTTPSFNSAQVDTVSGTAPLYFARAWVNFNGTFPGNMTLANGGIRASGNVSSVTDLGVGSYQINYTTLMPDTNYAGELSTGSNASGGINASYLDTLTTSSVLAYTYGVAGGGAGAFRDTASVFVAIFR